MRRKYYNAHLSNQVLQAISEPILPVILNHVKGADHTGRVTGIVRPGLSHPCPDAPRRGI
jgi:hypothetical protein